MSDRITAFSASGSVNFDSGHGLLNDSASPPAVYAWGRAVADAGLTLRRFFTKGVWDGAKGVVEGIGHLTRGTWDVATDAGARHRAWKSAQQAAGAVGDFVVEVATAPRRAAPRVDDATNGAHDRFQAARQRAEAGGQGAEFWGRLVGRGAFEVGTAAPPTGLATKGLEGASLLGRAGEVNELLGAAAHGAKAGRGVGAAARAGQAKAVFEAPSGLGGLAAPRTPGLGDRASMSELVQSGAIPGIKGVTLTDRVGNPVELYGGMFKLSQQNGIEYALTREGNELVLRSGAPDRVRIPSHAEPIAHTHPFDPETELPQKLPSRADVNVLNDRWSSDPHGPRPSSDIVWGPEPDHVTRYHATGLDRIPDPTKRGLKPGRIW